MQFPACALPRPWSIGLNPYLRRQVNKHGQEDEHAETD
nr:MAG TPA: hypothetical protein [Bacteriophage sp.]